MDYNEVPYRISVENWIATQNLRIHRYDRSGSDQLKRAIASYLQLSARSLCVTSGADGAIDSLFQYHERQGRYFYLPRISYPGFFNYARKNGCRFSFYEEERLDELARTASANDVVIVCNPGNPSGEVRKDVGFLIRNSTAQFIIDEAYIEFSPQDSVSALAATRSNCAVVRTLSKAFAAPGLRVGYIIASEGNLRALADFIHPFPVSNVAAGIGSFLVNNHLYVLENVKMAKKLTVQLKAKVEGLGWKTSPTSTYFFSMFFSDTAAAAHYRRELLIHRIHVGDFSADKILRVTSATVSANEVFLHRLKQIKNNFELAHVSQF